MSASPLSRTRLDFVEAAGRLWQLAGLPRSTGQIHGLLHLSPKPLSLDEIAGLLSISKASASTGTRQLVAWHAVRQVWVQGDRRDHFESVADLTTVLRSAYQSVVQPRLVQSRGRLELLRSLLEEDRKSGTISKEEYDFSASRLDDMSALLGRFNKLLPLAEKLL